MQFSIVGFRKSEFRSAGHSYFKARFLGLGFQKTNTFLLFATLFFTVPSRGAGPDVIVSTIGSGFQKYGTVGDITGYAVATVSCNLGTAPAIWLDTNNQHPVIGQNMYRYKVVNGAGRFEQIGMSWLKHGFCAADASGPNCGTCSPDGNCDWLTIGCTDTYGSGLNGNQSDLGPRSDVNAYTGVFSYPFPFEGQTGNAIYKRLQIHNADLDPAQNAGATYFCEVHYIPTDENRNERFNNTSWRPTTVGTFSGGGYNLAFGGATHQQESAIEAWPTAEVGGGVTLVDGILPNEGRFILGYKVTETVPGTTWHYEYALYNMNSDRSAGFFYVPFAVGTNLSNVGFHDVDYHSGEPYASTDWTPVMGGGNITWTTDSYATNVNANALRWGATYNFRFDADRPPFLGVIKVGLFKPGTPTSLNFNALVPNSCTCPGDANYDGSLDGRDVDAMANILAGNDAATPCADITASYNTVDLTDSDAFVDLLLNDTGCP
jgi:hypothetical protein